MKLRFWGTRGSIPVSMVASQLRSRLIQVLQQSRGLDTSDLPAVERFVDGLPFEQRGTYGGHSSCVQIEHDGGDHIIFIGEIVDAQSSGKDPLLFYRSTFHDLGATSSTTVWNGSQDDPHSGWFDATTSFTPIHLQPAPQTI